MIPFIGGVESEFRGLEEALLGAFVFEDGHLEQLNQLAEAIEGMSREERSRFQGAVIMENPQSLKDIIAALNHREHYSLHADITNYEELGHYAAYREGKEIPKELEAFFDYERQGRVWGQKHGCMTRCGEERPHGSRLRLCMSRKPRRKACSQKSGALLPGIGVSPTSIARHRKGPERG